MKAERIVREFTSDLRKKRNVVMVAPGTKQVGGVDTGKKALVVGVKQKLPLSQLADKDVVPAEVKGLVTDVIEVGEVTLQEEEDDIDRKRKWRPAPGGVSIGHYLVTAGTLGMAVKKGGTKYILSNNHVLAKKNQAEIGDPILQPGAHDGGTTESDKIAELSEFVPINMEKIPGPELTLLSPNGGEGWIIGETVTIKWQAESPGEVRIELSQNGGISWLTLASSVSSEEGEWSWRVLPLETERARIKVVDITNPPYNSDMSDGNFSIAHPKQPEPSTCKTSKATAAGLNLLWAAAGKKTRFAAVVPVSQESEPKPNMVDAALAKPTNDADVSDEILEIGLPTGVAEPKVGMKVKKSGRITGLTHGEITHVGATIKVNFREGRFATFIDQTIMPSISGGSDSGSIVLTEDNKIVGLLFAGSNKITVANRYSNVKKELGLD